MFSFANISYVSLLYPLLVLTNLDSNNEEFLEYIKSRYVTWVFFLPRKVVVLIHGRYYGGLLTTELLTEIGLAYPDDVTKVTVSFLFLITFGKVLIYFTRGLLSTLEPRTL